MSTGVQSFLAAVVIALFGLLPLGLMAMDASVETSVEQQVVDLASEPPAALPAPRLPAADEVSQTVITTPVPRIDGVSTEVARVLAANGFASEETIDGVPESVVRILSEHGAVLTIAVPEEG